MTHIVTVASYKGGVGKTTTAVQIAAFLQRRGPTLLLDGDSTRNATRWAGRRAAEEAGPFPFCVAPVQASAKLAHRFAYVVIDTGQKPSDEELKALVEGCHLMIVPAVPSFLDADGLGETIRALQELQLQVAQARARGEEADDVNYRVLLTKVAPDAAGAAAEMRRELGAAGVPMFAAEIPRLKALEKAAGAGLIVHEVKDPNALRAWSCYQAAGEELGL